MKLFGGSSKEGMTIVEEDHKEKEEIQKSLFDFVVANESGTTTIIPEPDDKIIPFCEPFVKWAGGKGQHLKELYAAMPKTTEFNRYFEPFLGGGALFFHLISAKKKRFSAGVYISDINSDLVNVYMTIKDNVEELIKLLKLNKIAYGGSSSPSSKEEYYYKLRDTYNSNYNNKLADKVERAAQFITLNKIGFNGLYRVNPNTGLFNVPIGDPKDPSVICDSSNLRNVSLALRNSNRTVIKATDYKNIILEENATEGDFIYFDPPYSPESSTANFVGYAKDGFYTKDQKELVDLFRKLDDRKCKVMLTNSDTPLINELYAPFAKHTIKIKSNRSINSKGDKRKGHTDLIIRNYS